MALHPNVTITIETMPGGADGDNIVKTRLATGEMADVFFYNSGALLQALHPAEMLVDLSDQPFMDNIVDSFKQSVSAERDGLRCAARRGGRRRYPLQQKDLRAAGVECAQNLG